MKVLWNEEIVDESEVKIDIEDRLLLGEIGLFAWFYLPTRIKKMED